MRPVLPPETGDDWLALTADELPVAEAYDWAVRPDCGAVVLFSGTVRDHAEGRDGRRAPDLRGLRRAVVPRLADDRRPRPARRWPTIGRIALLHRTGRLELGESSVLVVVSTPHRAEAFEAGRYAIDALKATVPIWKHEVWRDGGAMGHRGHSRSPTAGTVGADRRVVDRRRRRRRRHRDRRRGRRVVVAPAAPARSTASATFRRQIDALVAGGPAVDRSIDRRARDAVDGR